MIGARVTRSCKASLEVTSEQRERRSRPRASNGAVSPSSPTRTSPRRVGAKRDSTANNKENSPVCKRRRTQCETPSPVASGPSTPRSSPRRHVSGHRGPDRTLKDDTNTTSPQPEIMDEVKRVKLRLQASSEPRTMLCREAEYNVVREFWTGCIQDAHPGALYISGKPGTGKTATVGAIEQELQEWERKMKRAPSPIIKINCNRIMDPNSIYGAILEQLKPHLGGRKGPHGGRDAQDDNAAAQAELELLFVPKGKRQPPLATVILDEVDHLSSRGQEVMYHLFELPMMASSRLVLIAIANALDLTERLLPRLELKNCTPQCVVFNPYTKDDIVTIIKARLGTSAEKQGTENGLTFDSMAIEFLGRKVSGTSGDARKALDVCKLAIDLAEAQAKKTGDGKRVRVTVSHMMSVFNTTDRPMVARIKALELHQKLILLALVETRLGKSSATKKATTLEVLHRTYSRLATKAVRVGITRDEYKASCLVLLNESGFVSVSAKPAEAWHRTITLRVDPDDVIRSCRGDPVLGEISETYAPAAQ